jgi:hypothetical protein
MDDSESTMQHTKGEKNPWFQVALSSRTHVSSVEVRGRTGGCASRLFYGTGCKSSNPSGNFNNAKHNGATIRVSDSPCSGDNCPGTICGRITASNSAQAFTITASIWVTPSHAIREAGFWAGRRPWCMSTAPPPVRAPREYGGGRL